MTVNTAKPLSEFNPRVCDCEYCQSYPSWLMSDVGMVIELLGERSALTMNQNGDRLASFYHCKSCGQLLAVGCFLDGVQRGAVNGALLHDKNELGPRVSIQPRLLSAEQKLTRWQTLWGRLSGI